MLNGTIVMIRHGEKSGDALTERGMEQMRLAVTKACPSIYHGITRILHSPVGRTTQGAQVIAQALGVEDVQPLIGAGVEWLPPEGMEELIAVVKLMRGRAVTPQSHPKQTIGDWQKMMGGLGEQLRSRFYAELLQAIADLPDGSRVVVVSHEQLVDGWAPKDGQVAGEAETFAYILKMGTLTASGRYQWSDDEANTWG